MLDIESEPPPEPAPPEISPPSHRDISMASMNAVTIKQPSNFVLKIDKNGDQIHEEFIPHSQHGKLLCRATRLLDKKNLENLSTDTLTRAYIRYPIVHWAIEHHSDSIFPCRSLSGILQHFMLTADSEWIYLVCGNCEYITTTMTPPNIEFEWTTEQWRDIRNGKKGKKKSDDVASRHRQ